MVTYLGVMWQKARDASTTISASSDDSRVATCAQGPIEDRQVNPSALQRADEAELIEPTIVVDDETSGPGDAGRAGKEALYLISDDLVSLHESLTQVARRHHREMTGEQKFGRRVLSLLFG